MVEHLQVTRLRILSLNSVFIFFVNVVIVGHPATLIAAEPTQLIFDTDIGNDIDDALALGMIHSLESRGECKLLAVSVTKDEPMSAPFVDAVNTFYGRSNIPIGVVRKGPTPEPSKFTPLVAHKDGDILRFPHQLVSGQQAKEATQLLREVLCKADDHSIVIVQVGSSTNLARLLTSEESDNCPLTGMELVRKKVRLLSIMAGSFTPEGLKQPEYNVKIDIPAAQLLCAQWPTPMIFSGFEIGLEIPYPAQSIEKDFGYVKHHPIAEAYRLYDRMPYDRPTWDLTSVLYAVRPGADYFDLSPPGTIEIASNGSLTFVPTATGKHRYLILTPDNKERIQKMLVTLVSQPPDK